MSEETTIPPPFSRWCSKPLFSVEFEPHATSLEQKGDGYVVASLGRDSGYVPYTAFSAKASYIKENPEVIQAFTNALQKGMDYVNSHTPEEIAKTIQPQFKETSLEALTTIVKRYQDQDTWKEDTIFEEESFLLLQNILEEGGELPKRVPYEELVTTEYSKKAAQKKERKKKSEKNSRVCFSLVYVQRRDFVSVLGSRL